ncbi:MAG: GNAT family N-acetyltransferase [bacterium]|nr:GNAT family N-acetyltransferase [bacterium]
MTAPARTDVIIRHANPGDSALLIEFLKPFVDEGKLLPRTLSEVEELLGSFFIADQGGQIVGCAALEIYSRKLAEIRSLAVSSEVRRLGIGKRLVDACLERAQAQNILEVMAITSSEDFFISCGFDFTLPGEKKALFYQTRNQI